MKKGFTLIELIVVLGIFGVMMIAGANFLIQTLQNSNRASIENEVRQNASKIMQDISSSIRSAKCVNFSPSDGTLTGDVTLRTYADDCTSAVLHTYLFTFAGVVTKDGAQISANSVSVIDCGLICGVPLACKNGASFKKYTGTKSLEIALTVQAPITSQRQDFCARTVLRDTITPRMQ